MIQRLEERVRVLEKEQNMKLIEAVNANLAAQEMSQQRLPYDLALAVVKVKRATADETDFFLREERALVEEYADTDENGNIRMTGSGRFAIRGSAQEYEKKRKALADTETKIDFTPIEVTAPAEIKPALIEALDGFLVFRERGSEMKLPSIVYQDGIRQGRAGASSAGLNHNLGAGDGGLWDMQKPDERLLSCACRHAAKRQALPDACRMPADFSRGMRWRGWTGTDFYYGGVRKGERGRRARRRFAALGAYHHHPAGQEVLQHAHRASSAAWRATWSGDQSNVHERQALSRRRRRRTPSSAAASTWSGLLQGRATR